VNLINEEFILATYEDREIEIKGKSKGRWHSNIPYPNMFLITFPNGTTWDISSFNPPKATYNPFPIDEKYKVRILYTDFVAPHFPSGTPFRLLVVSA
jgi:hypothetical protein